jgi:hypothetical protein
MVEQNLFFPLRHVPLVLEILAGEQNIDDICQRNIHIFPRRRYQFPNNGTSRKVPLSYRLYTTEMEVGILNKLY